LLLNNRGCLYKNDNIYLLLIINKIKMKCGNVSEALYGLGVIGAIVYFAQHAVGFWAVVLAFFKGIFWPAFAVYKILGLLGL